MASRQLALRKSCCSPHHGGSTSKTTSRRDLTMSGGNRHGTPPLPGVGDVVSRTRSGVRDCRRRGGRRGPLSGRIRRRGADRGGSGRLCRCAFFGTPHAAIEGDDPPLAGRLAPEFRGPGPKSIRPARAQCRAGGISTQLHLERSADGRGLIRVPRPPRTSDRIAQTRANSRPTTRLRQRRRDSTPRRPRFPRRAGCRHWAAFFRTGAHATDPRRRDGPPVAGQPALDFGHRDGIARGVRSVAPLITTPVMSS